MQEAVIDSSLAMGVALLITGCVVMLVLHSCDKRFEWLPASLRFQFVAGVELSRVRRDRDNQIETALFKWPSNCNFDWRK